MSKHFLSAVLIVLLAMFAILPAEGMRLSHKKGGIHRQYIDSDSNDNEDWDEFEDLYDSYDEEEESGNEEDEE